MTDPEAYMRDPNPHAPSTLDEAHAQGALSSTALAALEKLCEAAPSDLFGNCAAQQTEVAIAFYDNARTHVPSLTATIRASEARIGELEQKLLIKENVQTIGELVRNATVCDGQTVEVSEATVQSLYRKWRDEQKAFDDARAQRDAALAEVERLKGETDAPVAWQWRRNEADTWKPCDQAFTEGLTEKGYLNRPLYARPSAPAPDQGVPGQDEFAPSVRLLDRACGIDRDALATHPAPPEWRGAMEAAVARVEQMREYEDEQESMADAMGSSDSAKYHNRRRKMLGEVVDALRALLPPSTSASPWRDIASARDVLAERQRQILAEGWTAEHDDAHRKGELARAAACYALGAVSGDLPDITDALKHWPWHRSWWKISDSRRDLVKAGALVLAEIVRFDRANRPAPPAPPATEAEASR